MRLGWIPVLVGLLWYASAHAFIASSVRVRGEVGALHCHDDDEGTTLCAVTFVYRTLEGEPHRVREGYASNTYPRAHTPVHVYYRASDPQDATRDEPWGLAGGPLLFFLGLVALAWGYRPAPPDARTFKRFIGSGLAPVGGALGLAVLAVVYVLEEASLAQCAMGAGLTLATLAFACGPPSVSNVRLFLNAAAPALLGAGVLALGFQLAGIGAGSAALAATLAVFGLAPVHLRAGFHRWALRRERTLRQAHEARVLAAQGRREGEVLFRTVRSDSGLRAQFLDSEEDYELASTRRLDADEVYLASNVQLEERAAPDGYRGHGVERVLHVRGAVRSAEWHSQTPGRSWGPLSLVALAAVFGLVASVDLQAAPQAVGEKWDPGWDGVDLVGHTERDGETLSCSIRVRPITSEFHNCHVHIKCGTTMLYGDRSGGYTTCQIRGRRVESAEDPYANDGDPVMSLRVDEASCEVDSGKEAPWRIAIEPAPEPPAKPGNASDG